MLENIALIKEVHELLPTEKAQALALSYLDKIALAQIGLNRQNQCSSLEIFYVMLVRALMTQDINVIIVTPFSLIAKLKDISTIIENIQILNNDKNIYILDNITNEHHYIGTACHIVK